MKVDHQCMIKMHRFKFFDINFDESLIVKRHYENVLARLLKFSGVFQIIQ